MTVTWQPATTPELPDAWPPPGIPVMGVSDRTSLDIAMRELGFTKVSPTGTEQAHYFNSADCSDAENHGVTGFMYTITINNHEYRYPFAVCNNAEHNELLVPWDPYFMGGGSGA